MELRIKTKEKAVAELCSKLGFREDLVLNIHNVHDNLGME